MRNDYHLWRQTVASTTRRRREMELSKQGKPKNAKKRKNEKKKEGVSKQKKKKTKKRNKKYDRENQTEPMKWYTQTSTYIQCTYIRYVSDESSDVEWCLVLMKINRRTNALEEWF